MSGIILRSLSMDRRDYIRIVRIPKKDGLCTNGYSHIKDDGLIVWFCVEIERDGIYRGSIVEQHKEVPLLTGDTADELMDYFCQPHLVMRKLDEKLCAEDPLDENYLLYEGMCGSFLRNDFVDKIWQRSCYSWRRNDIGVDEKLDLIVRIPIHLFDFQYYFYNAKKEIVELNCRKEGGVWFVNGVMVFPDSSGLYLTYYHKGKR